MNFSEHCKDIDICKDIEIVFQLEEQETRDNCKSSIEMFFYVKMPRVWAAMIKLGMKPESVVRGVQRMLSECRQVCGKVLSHSSVKNAIVLRFFRTVLFFGVLRMRSMTR